jgi:hypothetical protein
MGEGGWGGGLAFLPPLFLRSVDLSVGVSVLDGVSSDCFRPLDLDRDGAGDGGGGSLGGAVAEAGAVSGTEK